ncbi:MAG: hypothetical protein ACLQVL_12995 [Terriglobia bacterium]
MPSSVTAPEGQLSRRDKFRSYMQAFNPTAPAFDVIQAGMVLEDLHQSLYRNLAGRADLEPGSQQLIVGGVGSGKTTELLLARRWLIGQGHVLPIYIDVSALTDLSSLNAGALLASFGLYLGGWIRRDAEAHPRASGTAAKLEEIYAKVTAFAYGKQEMQSIRPPENRPFNYELARGILGTQRMVNIPGKLEPPFPQLSRDVEEIRFYLDTFLNLTREDHTDVAVIFDGLDRLLDATRFWSVVEQDLRLLRELNVSVIATAPLAVLFGVGIGQSISDHFDKVHHLTVIPSDSASASLWSVLEKRGVNKLLNPGLAHLICNYSGGVLRDLISLARDAAEEAYVSDRDFITVPDIEKVGHQLGTGYLRGLGPEAINALLQLESSKSFDLSQPSNVELLVTRRVLEYSSTDFRVHPALQSVIPRPEPKRA